MFNFEKLINSKIYQYADLIVKIIFINIMIVVFSLPIITFLPAVTAGYEQIKYYLEDREAPLFKSFIKAFKKNFFRHLIIGVILMIILGLFALNIRYYYLRVEDGNLFILGLYASLVLLFFALLTIVNVPLAAVYFPHLKASKVLKISFYIGLKYVFTSIFLFIPVLLGLAIVYYITPAFTFLGMGIPIFISLKISQRVYKRIVKE